mgnify:CR=1 FL=1
MGMARPRRNIYKMTKMNCRNKDKHNQKYHYGKSGDVDDDISIIINILTMNY